AVLGRDGKDVRRCLTLKDAVDLAESGDTIEIRGDGPFLCEPADAGTKALCIRAGDGFRPVLLGGKAKAPTLTTNGPLVLEGLDMRSETVDATYASNVIAREQTVRISHCRFLATGKQINVMLSDSPAVELQHAHFLAGEWPAVSLGGTRQGQAVSISRSL